MHSMNSVEYIQSEERAVKHAKKARIVRRALSPVMAAARVGIMLELRNTDVDFEQEREGQAGKKVVIHKYKTMPDGAVLLDKQQTAFGAQDDRAGFIGNLLRITAIDELPELEDIEAMIMALTGLRAVPNSHLDNYRQADEDYFKNEYMERKALDIPHGAMGLGTLDSHYVKKKTAAQLRREMILDVWMIDNMTPKADDYLVAHAAQEMFRAARHIGSQTVRSRVAHLVGWVPTSETDRPLSPLVQTFAEIAEASLPDLSDKQYQDAA